LPFFLFSASVFLCAVIVRIDEIVKLIQIVEIV
jgi:hypothetical protein